MGILYHNKYRIPTTRLYNWDYSQNGYYFVTICTKEKENYFGDITVETSRRDVSTNQIKLSKIGEIAENELLKTEEIRQNVSINQYVIMPNHIHAIIVIRNIKNDRLNHTVETSRRDVSTNTWRLKPNSLGSVIGQYKSVVTKRIKRELHVNFSWQPRYYDHIIRNEESYSKIIQYIKDNPSNWETDRNNVSVETPKLGVSI